MSSFTHVTGPFSGYREDIPSQENSQPSEVAEDDYHLRCVDSYGSQISTDIIGDLGEVAGYMQLGDGLRADCVWVTLSRLTGMPELEIKTVSRMLQYHRNQGTSIPELKEALKALTARKPRREEQWRSVVPCALRDQTCRV